MVHSKEIKGITVSLTSVAFTMLSACSAPLVKIQAARSHLDAVCGSNTTSKTCDLPGIPFYPVRYRCVHDTQWLEPITVVTFTITATDDKSTFKPHVATKILNFADLLGSSSQGPAVRALLAKIQQTPKADDYTPLLQAFVSLQDSTVIPNDMSAPTFPSGAANGEATPESSRFVLAANALTAEKYVDSSVVYYFNGSRPWAGSASVEADLASDGSLTKGTAQVESKTAETILGLLPFADVIKGVLHVSTNDAIVNPPPKKPSDLKYALALKLENKLYKVQKTAQLSDTALPPCPAVTGFAGGGTEKLTSVVFSEVTPAAPAPGKGDDAKPSTDGKKGS